MPGTPRKSRRFGGDAAHQRLMMANLVASLIAAEAIVTTEAKAKALRPVAEKMITKAKKGGLHRHRQVVAFLGDKEMAHKLLTRSRPATPTARVATRASSSSALATATTRRWRASNWCSQASSESAEPVTRVRMLVAYDGSGFAGFAPNPGVTTVGGTLASTLERVLRHPATVTCAGRTDAGVHAWGQVVTFDTDVRSARPGDAAAVGERDVRPRDRRARPRDRAR